ncbi:30S ribosomal protein S12 methylthiotransferase RimO [PVC group bacterium]|nr:30S ribosomal protein S12 methylthiotransferase RimO [PVC group bacterium]
MNIKRIGLLTLGCSKNLTDSEYIVSKLTKAGYQVSTDETDVDVILVNTCGFIEPAKKESIESILQAVQMKKEGRIQKVIVTGCMVERYFKELKKEIPEVDDFILIKDYPHIGQRLESIFNNGKTRALVEKDRRLLYDDYNDRTLLTPKHYAYLKIGEGCNHKCGFCMIPAMRGRFVSREIDALVGEAKVLGERGVKELILIAQDATYYGLDMPKKTSLAVLLRRLAHETSVEWIRILYAYPTTLTSEMIDVIAEEKKICKYIDMPLQHASDTMLKRMRRGYTHKKICELLKKIRSRIPEVGLRTTMIVGYPGEKEEDYQRLEDFVKEMKFERLGVFQYSDEENSFAYNLDHKVPDVVKKERYARLMEIQKKVSEKTNENLIGRIVRVLVDDVKKNEGESIGRTEWDAPEVDQNVIISKAELKPGQFANVKIEDALEYDLIGQVC